MRETPNSRLILLAAPGVARSRTSQTFQSLGIDASRLQYVYLQPRQKYLAEYHRIDIGLDTFPYNGHTTSLDALWMGVPVVTLVGRSAISRAGLSQLTNLGLPELVARTEAEYISRATALAHDRAKLAQLRSTLRDRMRGSPLMDGPAFAREIERAIMAAWEAGRARH
jgi:predicted O-linked N-acetylglucosamine transferase (SPINDLY family)